MQGDHDELEIFLEIRLIPSRIDQKLKNKGRVHGFLKGKFGPNSWVSRRHVTLQVKPLFAIFLIRNSIYKSNKNQKKMHKTSEIHISQNTTPFKLKFSPLDHKFLPF